MRTRTAVSVIGVLLLVTLVTARSERGGIDGSVTDASGRPLPGVTVTLTGAERRSTITTERGEYTFAGLAPGAYRVRFELAGFRTILRPVTVHAGRTARLDARLDLVSVEERVTLPKSGHETPAPVVNPAHAPMSAPPGVGAGLAGGIPAGLAGGTIGRVPERHDFRHRDAFNTEAYDSLDENPFRRVSTDPRSTFSIDVDTASYANVRRFLNAGALPPPGAVRIEELINYFRFDYPDPEGDAAFSIATEVSACPWNPAHRLALIGLRGRDLDARDADIARNLVFLIDVSGSMASRDKLPLVRTALRMLADTLTARDRVAIVVYAGASGLVLPSTPGDRKAVIDRAIAELESGGSTNGAAGISLAYRVAREHFVRGGINRVVLATDGDFNVGVTSQDELVRLIEEQRASGIFLSVLGVGRGNLKDSTMEKLADKGNGNYSYLDSLHEARKVLVREAGGTFVTTAKDVKIQIEFNPRAVAAYRLIGYENRVLRHEDFNDDRKDAGEIGAGHTVTALYEIVPGGVEPDAPEVDPLKYQHSPALTGAAGSDELLTVKVRYKTPDGDMSRLLSTVVRTGASPPTANLGFASAVAEFGMLLRGSTHAGAGTFEAAIARARTFRGADAEGYRAEFIRLAELAASLSRIETTARR
ncbi:MAG: YfbK domain-containing protein [Vicinamibacterales bacterium]